MPAKSPAKAAASRIAQAGKPKQRGGKGGGANRSEGGGAGRQIRVPVTASAEELARLVVLQAREAEVAGVLAGDLPEVMAAILHSAKGRDATAVASRSLLLRLMRHPAASAAERDNANRDRPAALRSMLVGRLTSSAPQIEGDLASSGRVAVTADGVEQPQALPF
jgi:hypothetical protein